MKIGRIILGAILAASCIFTAVGCDGSPKSSVGNTEVLNLVEGDTIAEITIDGYGTIKAKLFPDLAPKAVENFTMLAEQGYYEGLKIHRVLEDSFIQGGSLNGDGTGGKALINDEGTFELEISQQARHFYGALSYANVAGENAAQFFIVTNNEPQNISTIDTEQVRAAAAANTDLKAGAAEGSAEYNTYAYKEQYYTNLAGMVNEATEFTTQKYNDVGGMPMLDGGYTVFGQVFEGYEVLEAIAACEVENNAYSEKSKPVEEIIISSVKIVKYIDLGTGEAEEEPVDDEKTDTTDALTTAEAQSTTEASATAEATTTAEADVIVDDVAPEADAAE